MAAASDLVRHRRSAAAAAAARVAVYFNVEADLTA